MHTASGVLPGAIQALILSKPTAPARLWRIWGDLASTAGDPGPVRSHQTPGHAGFV